MEGEMEQDAREGEGYIERRSAIESYVGGVRKR